MSFIVTTDVQCDRCGNWEHGTTGPRPNKPEARLVAKRHGWATMLMENGERGDLCPRCYGSDRYRKRFGRDVPAEHLWTFTAHYRARPVFDSNGDFTGNWESTD